MFVHDFVHVARPFPSVVDAFVCRVQPALGQLVHAAWADDAPGWLHLGVSERELIPLNPVPVTIGEPRTRRDAVVFPISWPWSSARWFPELDADLEIARLDLHRTDLQLMGRHRFPPSVERWSAEESSANRVTVSAIRRLLEHMARDLESSCLGIGSAVGAPVPLRHE